VALAIGRRAHAADDDVIDLQQAPGSEADLLLFQRPFRHVLHVHRVEQA
jgi:hypothetical protein